MRRASHELELTTVSFDQIIESCRLDKFHERNKLLVFKDKRHVAGIAPAKNIRVSKVFNEGRFRRNSCGNQRQQRFLKIQPFSKTITPLCKLGFIPIDTFTK